jgi:hypothetical protein
MTLLVSFFSITNSERNWAQNVQADVKTKACVPDQPAFKGTGGWLFLCSFCWTQTSWAHLGSAQGRRIDLKPRRSGRIPVTAQARETFFRSSPLSLLPDQAGGQAVRRNPTTFHLTWQDPEAILASRVPKRFGELTREDCSFT